MSINPIQLEKALKILGQLLEDRGTLYEIVVIGGGGLLLLGLVERTTKDVDLIAIMEEGEMIPAMPLPEPLMRAAHEVGFALNLGKDWFNAGPADLMRSGLPEGFMTRIQTRVYPGLVVHLAHRLDQIAFKLYASVDQGPKSKHFADLIALQPTPQELEWAERWCVTQDVSSNFCTLLEQTVNYIHAHS